MDKVVLARLSGEITLKTPSVVNYWLSILAKRIKQRLYRKGFRANILVRESRVVIEPDDDVYSVAKETSKIFGIREAIVAYKVNNDIYSIVDASRLVVRNFSGSFAVRTHRAYKGFPLNSLQVNEIVGAKLLEFNKKLRVDLESPELLVEIEIRRDYSFVYEKHFSGYGGLPYGVSGKAVALVSGGIDSSLATWLAIKRGMKPVIVHADMTPYYTDEAKKRFLQFGKNELKRREKKHPFKIFISQFTSPLILLLVFAAVLSFFVNYFKHENYFDSVLILVIVLAAGIAGFVQDYKAERAIEALQRMASPKAKVIRDGKEQEIDSTDIVPDDLIVVESGDIIPADAVIVEGKLEIDESVLTGESKSITKKNKDRI